MNTGKSALGLEGNVAAALGYPIAIIAIISLIMEKENRFVKFHALQSILIQASFIVVAIALWIIGVVLIIGGIAASAASDAGGAIGGILGMLVGLIWLVIIVAYIAGIIMAAVKAYQGVEFKLPIIGNMAEKWTK